MGISISTSLSIWSRYTYSKSPFAWILISDSPKALGEWVLLWILGCHWEAAGTHWLADHLHHVCLWPHCKHGSRELGYQSSDLQESAQENLLAFMRLPDVPGFDNFP